MTMKYDKKLVEFRFREQIRINKINEHTTD